MRHRRRSGWFWAAIFAAIVAVVVITFAVMFGRMFAAVAGAGGTSSFGEPSIGVIDITGVIVDADKIDKQLERFGKDDGDEGDHPAHRLAGRRSGGLAGGVPRGAASAEGSAQAGGGVGGERGGVGSVLHRVRVRPHLCEPGECGGIDWRDYGVDELRRPAEVGEAEECESARWRAEGRR